MCVCLGGPEHIRPIIYLRFMPEKSEIHSFLSVAVAAVIHIVISASPFFFFFISTEISIIVGSALIFSAAPLCQFIEFDLYTK